MTLQQHQESLKNMLRRYLCMTCEHSAHDVDWLDYPTPFTICASKKGKYIRMTKNCKNYKEKNNHD